MYYGDTLTPRTQSLIAAMQLSDAFRKPPKQLQHEHQYGVSVATNLDGSTGAVYVQQLRNPGSSFLFLEKI